MALSSSAPIPSAISSFLLELDIQLPPDRTSRVVDHFHFDELSSSEGHDVLTIPRPSAIRAGVKNFFNGDGLEKDVIAVPRAVGQLLGNDSPLLAPIIKAPDTAYIYNPKEGAETVEEPFATGRQISLVSAFQARNSARFVVVGSAEMLEDAWFDAQVKVSFGKDAKGKDVKKQQTANRAFAKEVSAWTFKEIGVLKVGRIAHHSVTDGEKAESDTALVGTTHNPKIYRVKSDVVSHDGARSVASLLIYLGLHH